jgi:transcriptional regulator with XRE-family HTH domain
VSIVLGDIPPQRRRLAEALRRLRVEAGLSGEQLGRQIGLTQSKVSRLELGRSVPTASDVARWAEATGTSAEQRARLVEEAESLASEVLAWRRAERHGLARLQQNVGDVEVSSGLIRTFAPVLVPGLLQTTECAKRILQAAYPEGRPDIGEAVAARLQRQALLLDPSRRFEFVITEQALRWQLGPVAALSAQLDRILTVTHLPHVWIGVIPQARELSVWHTHGFNLYEERGDEDPIALIETLTEVLTISRPEGVQEYQEAFSRLRQAAVEGDEAVTLLRAIKADP